MQPMEVLLSAKLVRRTERADGSTRQLEHRSVSERLAGRSLRQSGSGSMTGRRSRHRRAQRVRCRGGVEVRELTQYPVPIPTGYCSYCRAVVRRVWRNGERGEIASSPSGGRVKDEHSPKAKRPILTDKSPHHEKTLLSMQFDEEKEYDCNGKKNQNNASVRRLINTGTLGVRLILALR